MYGVARFNLWAGACGWESGQQMADSRTETIEYFVNQYRKMPEENIDDYIHKFDAYMKITDEKA